MSFISEFKAFAMRGNVVDMAVGIIIGGAFGKIVSSIVADIIMPPVGLLLGGVKFTDLKFELKPAVLDAAGAVKTAAVSINYGNFLQTTVDFLIIAFAIFMMIKAMNSMKRKQEAPVEAPAPPEPTKEEVLLAEIRDILKEK
ncbi:MAG TPA: large-conductance mechanosensitive channel protein MscL [Prolixibacteraceae bacterium]|nr:large-conductance mechanosensitive channel protein MscL [Prolixibacteraceae bacterium]HPR85927.1 large-conductance mechanosensitive channel protein MscL [Prolixibacteraceae bacterium]